MALAAGTRLGPYQILGLIGSGGMGEVYRGRDTRLDRTVAIKILSAGVANDPERRARLEREARAVATLNHPNIVTIHSVEEADDLPFLTMEFVEGSGLGDLIPNGGLPIDRLLKFGIAVADALAAAQQRGVTHRDLKPANIMVTPSGQVKVLDFGIAKLQQPGDRAGAATAISPDLTGAGHIVGTLTYMSPEQAEGRVVDSRSDIFSFGVILHQMATGAPPFKGDTPVSILSSIVKDTPTPVTTLRPDLPPDLGRIIRHCLAKDPDRRYQSAADLRNDLEDVLATLPAVEAAARIAERGPAVRRTPWRTRRAVPAVVGSLLAAVVLVVLGVRWNRQPGPPTEPVSLTGMRMTRLTHTGTAGRPAIAPDGRYVAHVVTEGGQSSLWLRQVATSSSVQIVPPAPAIYSGVAFSPDGNYVYYSTYERGYGVAALWQVPALGGAPRKIVNDVDSSVSFSPDGTRFVFVRNIMVPSEGRLVAASADGTGERVLASTKAPEALDLYTSPAWSPDGAHVAVSQILLRGGAEERIAVFDVRDGTSRSLGTKRWRNVGDVAWLADGSALALSASEAGSPNRQLWLVAYPGGEATRITNDLTNYETVSLSADSRVIVTMQADVASQVWVVSDGDVARARPITSGSGRYDGFRGIAWTPDGRLVYASAPSGNHDIWIMDADGGHSKQLTFDPGVDSDPAVTPDGRFIVFTSTRSGAAQIWRMDIDGANQVQLSRQNIATNPLCAGAFVLYTVVAPDASQTIWRVPILGGEPARVSGHPVRTEAVSPDGRFVAGLAWNDPELRYSIGIVAIGTPGPPTLLPVFPRAMAWSPIDDVLTYVELQDGMNVVGRRMGTDTPRRLTGFTSDEIFRLAWSRDGRQLALARGRATNDVVLLSAQK